MRGVRSGMPLIEFAALVHAELDDAGVTTVLSGGAAVDIHSGGGQPSDDLDFVTGHLLAEIEPVLARLGFVRARDPRQSVFTHPSAQWYLEFPAAPLAFGNRTVPVSECWEIGTSEGPLRIITPTHCLMDRLAACGHWDDTASLTQALSVARARVDEIDWDALRAFVEEEGIAGHRLVSKFWRDAPRFLPSRSGSASPRPSPA
ncbi:MAG: hypothetical protein F4X36_21715 [Gammaproteobacteria bacterium]|nr:hypothetical protein [Gammaproteobacteria bacterium]